jgi:hypothetical protein
VFAKLFPGNDKGDRNTEQIDLIKHTFIFSWKEGKYAKNIRTCLRIRNNINAVA